MKNFFWQSTKDRNWIVEFKCVKSTLKPVKSFLCGYFPCQHMQRKIYNVGNNGKIRYNLVLIRFNWNFLFNKNDINFYESSRILRDSRIPIKIHNISSVVANHCSSETVKIHPITYHSKLTCIIILE